MTTRNWRGALAAAAGAAALLAAAAGWWATGARAQINATPTWIPIGVAAHGSGSAAWFHEPSSRQVVVCHRGASGNVACETGRLP